MPSPQQPTTWPQKTSGLASEASMLVGVVVLAGWWLGVARIVRPIPQEPTMVPSAALGFIFLGMSLLLLRRSSIHLPDRWLAQALAAATIALAGMTLAGFMMGSDLAIDRIFPSNPSLVPAGFAPGRMGAGGAVSFALIGTALLTLDLKKPPRVDLSEGLALGAFVVALTTAAGYAYGAASPYQASAIPDTGMAPHTIVAVMLLSVGVICARPRRPLMSLVTSHRAGGLVVRRFLIGTSAILLLGLFTMFGLRQSLYDEPFAAALLAVAAMAIAVGLVLLTGRTLDRVDMERTASEQAVVEREERLRDLIHETSDGVFIADLDDHYSEVNDAMCKILGYSREEILGKSIRDFVVSQDHPRVDTTKAVLLRGGTHVDEWMLERPHGSRLPVEVRAKVLRDRRWLGLVRDISVRQEIEHAAEAVAEAVMGSSPSSLQDVLKTIALEAKSVTHAEYAALGLTADGDHLFELRTFVGLPPEEASRLGRFPRSVGLLGLVAERDRPLRVANIYQHPAFGGLLPHYPRMTSFLGVPIRRHGRNLGSLYLTNKLGAEEFTLADETAVERLASRAGIVIETARVYKKEGLERAWLESVIDQMPEGVVLTDNQGSTRAENRSIHAFSCDTGQHDQLGQPVRYDLHLPNGQPVALDDQPQVRAVSAGTTTIGRELLLRHPDGRLVPMLVSAAPVFDGEGKRSGAVTIYQDISAFKELERMRDEWSSIIAHDLRQPVEIILLQGEMLARMVDQGQTKEAPKAIDRIRRSTTRLNKMIDDLLDVSRLETRRLALDRAETDLASIMDDAVERLSLLAPGHPVQFQARVRPAPVLVDPVRLEQVLGNLIANAGKYGQPEKEILVELTASNSDYEVAVVNRGVGIQSTDMPKLFQRFWRSDTTPSGSNHGLGLGLYICKGLVEAQGGRIWADSTPGETTTFHFTIPKLQKPPAAAG
jgi:PAS domain S-box-containing protein